MALQNRVTPLGEIIATPERGTLMGNRGGRLHDDRQRLGRRRWASKAWIACVLEFRGRHNAVMQPGRYTEMFFLDEATALAAGHRPCFECRHADARAFAAAWAEGNGLDGPPRAGEMDTILHAERLAPGRRKRLHTVEAGSLPDGAMILHQGVPHLVADTWLLPWSFAGYRTLVTRTSGPVELITPPSTLEALRAGFPVMTHPSANH